jgi:hypothetical protein
MTGANSGGQRCGESVFADATVEVALEGARHDASVVGNI